MKKVKGFTLIELLIVIALLALVAVAVLSAINPLEQMKKARDAARKSDAAELLNAYERFYTTFGCHTWDYAAGCVGAVAMTTAVNPDFAVNGNSEQLILKQELKEQFITRDAVRRQLLWVSEQAGTKLVSVCFEPESQTGRNSGFGPLRNISNTAVASCSGAYRGQTANPGEITCFVCVPQ